MDRDDDRWVLEGEHDANPATVDDSYVPGPTIRIPIDGLRRKDDRRDIAAGHTEAPHPVSRMSRELHTATV
ncbi:MAG TPA: hypothetical protein VKB03_15990 [Conexibacter sp.]|nr:hypothetical protein [Conexibacter sp.]